MVKLRYYVSAKTALERHPQTDEAQVSFTDNNPPIPWFWNIMIERLNQLDSSVTNMYYEVKMRFYCKLWNQAQEVAPYPEEGFTAALDDVSGNDTLRDVFPQTVPSIPE